MNVALKLWYRTYQLVMDGVSRVIPWRQPVLAKGEGSLGKLPEFLQKENVSKVLIVTDPGLMAAGIPQQVLATLESAGIAASIYDKVEANPSDITVEAIQDFYLGEGCQALVAVGGGSAIDAAKGAGACIARPKKSIVQMAGLLKVGKALPLLIAVPTTAGTGSETTITAVITDAKLHHKFAVNDLHLIPRYAILDPAVTAALPPQITATTGMDALTHALEAYISIHNNTKDTLCWAEEAVAIIFNDLEAVYTDGLNMEKRMRMLTASFEAGAAFTHTGVGYVHAIAHTMGGLYKTPHGLANAVILPIVLEEYGSAIWNKLAHLYDIAGLNTGASGAEAKTKAFISEIRAMNRRMNIPSGFDFIRDQDVPQMIRWALSEANPLYPVPVLWDAEDMSRVIERVRREA